MIRPLILALAVMALATPALAARPDTDHCRAALPARGATFAGIVRYVGDGDMLCVGPGPDPSVLIEVRVADFYAPELHQAGGVEARDALRRLALGKRAVCVADHRSYDRIVARCEIGGQSVGDLMHGAGVREGGSGR